jgi:hypothetical protein
MQHSALAAGAHALATVLNRAIPELRRNTQDAVYSVRGMIHPLIRVNPFLGWAPRASAMFRKIEAFMEELKNN